MLEPQPPGGQQVLRRLTRQQRQCRLHPGECAGSRVRRAALVRVIEVRHTPGGVHLSAQLALPPGQHTGRRAQLVQQLPDPSLSRTITRSTPRTCLDLAATPSRRAAPTSANPASGAGAVTSSTADPGGSLSEPPARNAPRHAAAASQLGPETTVAGSPGPADRSGRADR